ncbi:hypothetical protein CN968_26120 [Bacillus thuringiensis]|nr:hypothetical protein CN968_26120 [Bacillus thuringiensis]
MFLEDIVIVCISGFRFTGDPDSPIINLRDDLRKRLSPLGIPDDNIFHRPWNQGGESQPDQSPNHNDILREIQNRTKNPRYIALVGHSYGGWAACKVSRAIDVNHIVLLDPVFGPDNKVESDDVPIAPIIENWCQDNAIMILNYCTPWIRVPCVSTSTHRGLACGNQDVPNVTEYHDVEYVMDRDGTPQEHPCKVKIPGTDIEIKICIKKLATHITMDYNPYIAQRICDTLYNEISNLIETAKREEFLTMLTLLKNS